MSFSLKPNFCEIMQEFCKGISDVLTSVASSRM
jgi:hypothetical protein